MINLRSELDALEGMRERLHQIFPSYITHIRFPRYKNMAAGARLDFTFPITALVGANGSGKTSVLNALYGAPRGNSTGEFWFSTEVDPILEGEGSPNRFVYGHYSYGHKAVVETRKARVRKVRKGRDDPNYWEPTKEAPGDGMVVPAIPDGKKIEGRSKDRWNPVGRTVLYINFRKELSAFDKYFYFGKDPVKRAAGDASARQRIISKKDVIRRDAVQLAKVIDAGDTTLEHYGRKIATENRLLTKKELETVSYVLGRTYEEARVIRHRLFKGEEGLSIRFKTIYGQYSEAFAGSGEVAVASCVIQVLAASAGTLVLLDEPEVSLHPGAQERLLAFLAQSAKLRKIQVIFSTHSPHLVSALPDDAIKTFVQVADGSFSVIPSTHPYAAFRRLGATDAHSIVVLVEDRLAKHVLQQAVRHIADEALRKVFRIEYMPGGASAILTYRIPVLMEGTTPVLVMLDGDQRKVVLQDPNDIPVAQDGNLGQIIKDETGVEPAWLIDGGAGGGNAVQRIAAQRKYLGWIIKNLKYLPLSSPEEIALKASGRLQDEAGDSPRCKSRLEALAKDVYGDAISSETIDGYGAVLLGENWEGSEELREVARALEAYAAIVRPN